MFRFYILLSILLRCGTGPYEWGQAMRIEHTSEGLLVYFASHYISRGAQKISEVSH